MTTVPGWRWCRAMAWVVLAAMLAPVLAGILAAAFDPQHADAELLGFRGAEVLFATIGWSLGLSALAVLLAVVPGSRLFGWATRGRGLILAAWLIPMFLPPALLFDAWWIQVGPDSWIGRMAGEADQVVGHEAHVEHRLPSVEGSVVDFLTEPLCCFKFSNFLPG